MRILHLAHRAEWDRARIDGAYRGSTRGRTLEQVGFIHTSTSTQLPIVVEAFYADAALDDHVLLVVDVAACEQAGSPVRWEVPHGAAEPFPHIHGPLPVEAVVAALPVRRDEDGRFVLPDLRGLSVVNLPSR